MVKRGLCTILCIPRGGRYRCGVDSTLNLLCSLTLSGYFNFSEPHAEIKIPTLSTWLNLEIPHNATNLHQGCIPTGNENIVSTQNLVHEWSQHQSS